LRDPGGSESLTTVLVAFGANILIAVAKSVAAAVTGSASLVAEAAHSWADAGNEVFLLIANRRSRRPADAAHPLGHGREAYVWSLFAALGLFAAGAGVSVTHGIQELIHPEPASHFAVGYVVLAVSFVKPQRSRRTPQAGSPSARPSTSAPAALRGQKPGRKPQTAGNDSSARRRRRTATGAKPRRSRRSARHAPKLRRRSARLTSSRRGSEPGPCSATWNYSPSARLDLTPPQAASSLQQDAQEVLGLTPREVQVLNLLGRGYTNREIAATLVISVKTVSVHVSHILRKLGAPNRLEAAATIHRLAPSPTAPSEDKP
jgi:DNA-binding CsgD family transcriptional regulator